MIKDVLRLNKDLLEGIDLVDETMLKEMFVEDTQVVRHCPFLCCLHDKINPKKAKELFSSHPSS